MNAATVIIRNRNEAESLRVALSSVAKQSVDVQVVLVDNESTDDSIDVAEQSGVTVVSLPRGEFTYGGAINLGAERAGTEYCVTLSAHCALPDPGWIERAIQLLQGKRAAVSGTNRATFEWSAHSTPRNPYRAFTNHASVWRRSVWQIAPFPTDVIACEDKIWARHVVSLGFTTLATPTLRVSASHRKSAGICSLWRRSVAEGLAMGRAGAAASLNPLDRITDEAGKCSPGYLRPSALLTVAGQYVGEKRSLS